MEGIVRLIFDVVQYIWPFEIIMEWERGEYFVFGRHVGSVGRGCWPYIPFFMQVRSVDVVPDVFITNEQTIDLKDGETLTFTATIRLEVFNAKDALLNVQEYEESAVEDAAAILAAVLAESDTEELSIDNRDALLKRCRTAINKEVKVYGVRVLRVRLNNFIRNIHAFRHFND